MPEPGTLALFSLAALALIVVPGPAVIYVVYLILLGLRELRGRAAPDRPRKPEPAPLRRLFWQGVLVNALNPKTALFFLAFLPQFVNPGAGPVVTQILVLGAVFIVIAFVSDSAWGLAAGTLGPRLRESIRRRVQRWGSGSVFVALGVGTALSTTRRAV